MAPIRLSRPPEKSAEIVKGRRDEPPGGVARPAANGAGVAETQCPPIPGQEIQIRTKHRRRRCPKGRIADRDDEAYLPRPAVLRLAERAIPAYRRHGHAPQARGDRAHLGWKNAELGQIVQRAANPVVKPPFAYDKIEAGFDLAVAGGNATRSPGP